MCTKKLALGMLAISFSLPTIAGVNWGDWYTIKEENGHAAFSGVNENFGTIKDNVNDVDNRL